MFLFEYTRFDRFELYCSVVRNPSLYSKYTYGSSDMVKNEQITVFDSDSDTTLYQYKASLDKIQNELMRFGLSPTQAKVFIFLGKYGSKSAPDIARALELPRTETYHVVNSLQSLGLVTAELTHPTKYSALEMKEAINSLVKQEQLRIDSLADKEDELSELWEQIPFFAVKTDETKQEKMQLLQGSGPIINKIKSMVSESMHTFKIYCSRQDASRFYHSEIFDMIEKSHSELQIIITPSDKIPDFLKSSEDKVRIIPKNSENKCFIVSDKKEVLMFLRNSSHPSHRVFACWSDSDSLVDMMDSLFELSWENGDVAY